MYFMCSRSSTRFRERKRAFVEGVWYPRDSLTDGWHRFGNIRLETGESLDEGNPYVNGQLFN